MVNKEITNENIRKAIRDKCNEGGRITREKLYDYLNNEFGISLSAAHYKSNSDSYWFNCHQQHEEDYLVGKILKKSGD